MPQKVSKIKHAEEKTNSAASAASSNDIKPEDTEAPPSKKPKQTTAYFKCDMTNVLLEEDTASLFEMAERSLLGP